MQRKTGQREAIKRALSEAGRPLSPLEIHELARVYAPGLGIATVYRAVKTLIEENWIAVVELPGEAPRYELGSKPHHHHFHCVSCRKLFEVDGCSGHFHKLTPAGFVLQSHELLLRGLCGTCAVGAPSGGADASHNHEHHHHSHSHSH